MVELIRCITDYYITEYVYQAAVINFSKTIPCIRMF